MGKSLVIVESPAKAKTINKILGGQFTVTSSVGHVRDLPVKSLGVEINNGFKPKYVLSPGKKKVVDELRKAARECDAIYLAPDPDREGEAIAWHLREILEKGNRDKPFLRVQYNEITPAAVRRAFEHPGEIDANRVNAQQARRILDRIVGYQVSPMLWRRIKRGLSAGRVQSVALRLVCEREEEIRRFVPEAYWLFGARVRKQVEPRDPFAVRLVRIGGEKAAIRSAAEAEAVQADLDGRRLLVREIATRESRRRAPPPFITSSLQQAASNQCGFSPKRTMDVAQTLYEGVDLGQEGTVGLITYMRTDSFNVAREAQEDCRRHVTECYGPDFCPAEPNVYRSRETAQGAHEAIRPTDVRRTPESLRDRLDGPQARLYSLIWRRFVASQMTPAVIETVSAAVEAEPPAEGRVAYTFRAASSRVTFPGYMKVTGTDIEKPDDESGEVERLPPLSEGEALERLEWLSERKETSPPPRYSEATLVRELERNGVGRPSTYAQILSTLGQRHYVRRDKRTLHATALGMQVNGMLVELLDELFNVSFTAGMENSLDDIESGKQDWTAMLGGFYAQFSQWMERTKSPAADLAKVRILLDALARVTEWAPEVKRGRRTYSDQRFVESIARDVAGSDKPISQRQFEALARIACYYRRQAPELEQAIRDAGCGTMLSDPEFQPPRAATIRKLELLRNVALDASARNFVDSLRARVDGSRSLTPAQLKALNNIVLAGADRIEGFEGVRGELEIEESAVAEDHESGPLLAALEGVKDWHAPVVRGKRVFNDRSFYDSLVRHFRSKGFLSPRQRAALRKMVYRYRAEAADYAALEERFGLGRRKAREEDGEGGDGE